MKLKEKVAIITGGNSGIGRVMALSFAREGARIVICGRRRELVEKTENEIGKSGAEVIGIVADVGVEKDVKSMVAKAVERFGTIDILVNNASAEGPTLPIHEIDGNDWRAVVDTNLNGSFLLHQIRPPGHDPEKVRKHLEHRLHRRRLRLSSADAVQRDQMGHYRGNPVDCRGGWSSQHQMQLPLSRADRG